MSCALSSLDVQEPMIASTLAHIHRWVLIEQPKAWPPRPGIGDLQISEEKRAMIARALEIPGTRMQWIRNRSSSTSSLRIFLCENKQIYCAHDQTKELMPEQMHKYSESLILVCTHGSRDRCCGILGGAIYSYAHKQAPLRVWQASHLGGHRFAPTLLVLPQGMMYGRIEESDIPGLLDHSADIPFSCDRLRGVPRWPKEVQTAAHALWKTESISIDSFSSAKRSENSWDVSLTYGDQKSEYIVSKESLGVSIAASCADTKTKELFRYICQTA